MKNEVLRGASRTRVGILAAAVLSSLLLAAAPATAANARAVTSVAFASSVASSSSRASGAVHRVATMKAVPNVVGKTVAAAEQALKLAGFKFSSRTSTGGAAAPGSDWIVTNQSPGAASRAKTGTVVVFVATKPLASPKPLASTKPASAVPKVGAPPAPTSAPRASAKPVPTVPTVDYYLKTYGSFAPKTAVGLGNATVSLPSGAKDGIVSISYGGSSAFSIQSLDSKNQPTRDVLANSNGSYSGTRVFGLDAGTGASLATLRVSTSGPWSITISPLSAAAALPSSGSGDGVFRYDGGARTWAVASTSVHEFFLAQYVGSAVTTPGVNTNGAYAGKVPMQAGPSIVVIESDGTWTIR
jgi:PASTA domain